MESKLNRRNFVKSAALTGVALSIAPSLLAYETESYKVDKAWKLHIDPKYPVGSVTGVAVDKDGHVYVAGGEGENEPILIFDAKGKFIKAFGKGIIAGKHEVKIINNSLWATDTAGHQVHEFTLDGELIRSFGVAGEPNEDETHFNKPTDVAIAKDGSIFISDGYGNRRVVKLDQNGKYITSWGMKGNFEGDFNNPHNIEVDENNKVYVADRENHRIQVFNTEGKFIAQWNNTGRVFGLTLAPQNQILATEGSADQMRLLIMDRKSGKIIQSIGSKGSLPGQFDTPHSVALAPNGDIFVGETTNKRVQKFVRK